MGKTAGKALGIFMKRPLAWTISRIRCVNTNCYQPDFL